MSPIVARDDDEPAMAGRSAPRIPQKRRYKPSKILRGRLGGLWGRGRRACFWRVAAALLPVGVEAEEHVGAALLAARGEVGDAAGPGEGLGDLAGGVDAADLDEARAALLEGL